MVQKGLESLRQKLNNPNFRIDFIFEGTPQYLQFTDANNVSLTETKD